MRQAWNDPALRAGTRVKVALWLVDEVGEGGTFTKAELRAAFPDVEQVDRRMRDLRSYQWIIDTNREDPGLAPNTLKFVKAGIEVWDPRAASEAAGGRLTSKERAAVMAADDYMCTSCGIAGGEPYPDTPGGAPAQLSVSRRTMEPSGGPPRQEWVTECKRCRVGSSPDSSPTLGGVLEKIDLLSAAEREELAQWIRRGRRQPRRVEALWTEYRRLPTDSREDVAERLRLEP